MSFVNRAKAKVETWNTITALSASLLSPSGCWWSLYLMTKTIKSYIKSLLCQSDAALPFSDTSICLNEAMPVCRSSLELGGEKKKEKKRQFKYVTSLFLHECYGMLFFQMCLSEGNWALRKEIQEPCFELWVADGAVLELTHLTFSALHTVFTWMTF